MKYLIITNILLVCLLVQCKSGDKSNLNKCNYRIHRKCNTDQSYTEEELENARIYIQKRFATTNPIRKPCNELYVRKDIKCLSPKELKDLIDVFKKLYANGFMDKMAELHDIYWAANHKFDDGIMWHRWFEVQVEKKMRKINPKVTLPYWDFLSEFKSAEKSIVFDIFGHAGNEDNDYCIPDGPFANFTVNYPNTHCLKREWELNGKTPIWEPSEWMTAILQMGIVPEFTTRAFGDNLLFALLNSTENYYTLLNEIFTVASFNKGAVQYLDLFNVFGAFTGHFKTHLSLGGYNGDLSLTFAPIDPVFYLFHLFFDLIQLKWQLQKKRNLVPNSYNVGNKFHWDSQQITLTDLETDTFAYYRNITVKESFQVGFGEVCYIYDQLIKPINDIMKNKKPKLPEAVKRLRSALPKEKFKYYFPKFALYPEEVTVFDYTLPDVGNCNLNCTGTCNQIPVAKKFTETAIGLRLWQRFITDENLDITPYISIAEQKYEEFISDLNHHNYCSPYA